MVISLIPDVSPVTPVTTVLPVLFVLAVAGVREAIEEVGRMKADRLINNQLFDVSQDGLPVAPTKSEDIRVGDIVRLRCNQRVPADLVVLRTSLPDGLCYAETSQLDGETNLKPFHAPVYTADMPESEVLALRGTIVSEKPTHNFKAFQSRMVVELEPPSCRGSGPGAAPRRNVVVPLGADSLLLQGASLRNTDYAYCVVVFTGRHTKLALNQRKPPSKFSHADRIMNKFVLGVFVFICIVVTIAATAAGLLARESGPYWYLYGGVSEPTPALDALKMFFSYFVVAGYFIPMSLVVTLEVSRFVQALLISCDRGMMHPVETDDTTTPAATSTGSGGGEGEDKVEMVGAQAKTSNLNDELSLIRYVFSDKTGTLTQNKMVFHTSFVNGRLYTEPMRGDMLRHYQSADITPAEAQPLEDYLLCLALCNSVVPRGEGDTDATLHFKKDKTRSRLHLPSLFLKKKHQSQAEDGQQQAEDGQQPKEHKLRMLVRHHRRRKDTSSKGEETATATATTTAATAATLDGDRGFEIDESEYSAATTTTTATTAAAPATPRPLTATGATTTTAASDDAAAGAPGAPGERKQGKYKYNAQSPDETALCMAAQANAFTFVERTQKYLVVEYPDGRLVKFHVVAAIEFTSERRRMSVVLRKEDGSVVLYTKGADNVMLPLLAAQQPSATLLDETKEKLASFSRIGLRALVVAMRVLPESMLMDWTGRYDEACSVVGDRDAAIRSLFEELERDMTLLGCTAVEDKLQDGVPQAIADMLRAGIQVWMITGDKQETAINIGKACRLVAANARLVIVDDLPSDNPDAIKQAMQRHVEQAHQYRHPPPQQQQQQQASDDVAGEGAVEMEEMGEMEDKRPVALVVSGHSAHVAVGQEPKLFMELVGLVDSVVCAQVTPLQKAQVVQCVKSQTDAVCLAIGDGANDVSMIQTADVGVGIFGREGTQAARASDFAIRQFRDLVRLITLHGRHSMVRNSSCIKYCFYKNVMFILVQYMYSAYSLFSSKTVYDDWILTFFNIFLTSLPPFFMALFEKDVPDAIIEQNPELHRDMIRGSYLRVRDMLVWIAYGVFQAVVVFFTIFAFGVPTGVAGGVLDARGNIMECSQLSAYLTVAGLLTLDVTALLHTRHWTRWTVAGMVFSLAFLFVQWAVQSYATSLGSVLGSSMSLVHAQPLYYAALLFTIVASTTPSIVYQFLMRQFRPSPAVICSELAYEQELEEKLRRQQSLAEWDRIHAQHGKSRQDVELQQL